MNYQLVSDDSPQGLETVVLQEIQKGWKPQGGVAVAAWYEPYDEHNPTSGAQFLFYQAMTKE